MHRFIEDFHKWYYETEIWDRTSFLGVPSLKCVFDLWNYQEIISELLPAYIVEVGVYRGGSALFFSTILQVINPTAKYIGVEKDITKIHDSVFKRDNVRILECISTAANFGEILRHATSNPRGRMFCILDSRHDVDTVYHEMTAFSDVMSRGDYLIVEDSNVNGNPVLPAHGPGPMEAIRKFEQSFPTRFTHNTMREKKFGISFSPYGYLIRN